MNFVLHFLLNFFIIDLALGCAKEYVLTILFFSIILDLDHLPYLIKEKWRIINKKFGSKSRTRFHELYGLALISIMVITISLITNPLLVKVIALSLILHLTMDFLIGKSRPFYPFSKEEINLGFLTDKNKIYFEIIATTVLGVILWLNMTN
ncbi:MAG: hypothetical protein GOU97_01395 [Nanoarchaeota archaeon]|nr:hypothetical protein [Nanoarchaeota archaeon]